MKAVNMEDDVAQTGQCNQTLKRAGGRKITKQLFSRLERSVTEALSQCTGGRANPPLAGHRWNSNIPLPKTLSGLWAEESQGKGLFCYSSSFSALQKGCLSIFLPPMLE
jgi:hypothetical protein